MKNNLFLILAVLTAAFAFWACKGSNTGSFPGKQTFDRDASYALGMNLGAWLRESMISDGIIPDLDELLRGMKDIMSNSDTRFSIDEARARIDAAQNTIEEERTAEASQIEIDFLRENAGKPGVMIAPSGIQYEVITETQGRKPRPDDTVQVHYEGRLLDGTLFDNSYEFREPAEFALNMVIPGWAAGLQLMSVGSKYKLYIPWEMGYGARGVPQMSGNGYIIPPYSTLVFIVELLAIR